VKAEVAKHLKRAEELLEVARENLENGHPADSVSRSYYAMFHAAAAVTLCGPRSASESPRKG